MRKYYAFLILALFTISTYSQTTCNSSKKKILMVGDSWSNFADQFNSIDNALDYYGFSDVSSYTNGNLSVNGKETKWMLEAATIAEIRNALAANPDIKILNVSIGGNDILGDIRTSMDSIRRDSLFSAIIDRTDKIIKMLDSLKPGIKMYFPAYDYPNFEESINDYAFGITNHPFYDTWDKMGQPTYFQINNALNEYHAKLATLINLYPNVSFVPAAGLMQFKYGQTYQIPGGPTGTYPAESVTVPGGNVNFPSPLVSMNDYAVFYDSFHFSDEAYDYFYNYHFKHYYFNQLRANRDLLVKSNGGLEDGYTDNTLTSNNYVTLGDNGTSIKGIVSFNTSTIAMGETVGTASLFLKRDSITTMQPLTGGKVLVTIKNGFFGASQDIEIGDYFDAGDASETACYYGVINSNGSYIRIDIPSSLVSHFNTSGITQLKLEGIDGNNGGVHFITGDDALNGPELDIVYTSNLPPASINEMITVNSLNVYPNPSNGNEITVIAPNDFNGVIQLINMDGKTSSVQLNNNKAAINSLAKGVYIVKLTQGTTVYQTRFVKM